MKCRFCNNKVYLLGLCKACFTKYNEEHVIIRKEHNKKMAAINKKYGIKFGHECL